MTTVLEHVNNVPAAPAPADEPETAYRLTIGYGTFGVPEALKLDGPSGLAIGDEVNALVRLRVVGTSDREATSRYDTRTVTTDAKIVEFIEIDGAVVNTPAPAEAQKVEAKKAARRFDWGTRAFLALCAAFVVLSVLGALAGCSTGPQALPAASTAPAAAPVLDAQATCRDTARRVFAAVAKDEMTQDKGQAEVDKACAGVGATDRKAILDAERVKALQAWADSTPTS